MALFIIIANWCIKKILKKIGTKPKKYFFNSKIKQYNIGSSKCFQ